MNRVCEKLNLINFIFFFLNQVVRKNKLDNLPVSVLHNVHQTKKFNSIQDYMICRNSFQDYTLSHIVLPNSFCSFFHLLPRVSSVNKVKKSYCKECVCVCVFGCVFNIYRKSFHNAGYEFSNFSSWIVSVSKSSSVCQRCGNY